MKIRFLLFIVSPVLSEIIPNEYIIKFNSDLVNRVLSPVVSITKILNHKSSEDNSILHTYSKAINGIAIKADLNTLNIIKTLPNILSIEPNQLFRATLVQKNATWGPSRISQRDKLNNPPFEYRYDKNSGSGINIYIVDTGINIDHIEFEGRASWGYTAIKGASNKDKNGHGTHCAGISASKTYGVAKKANLIAVKVLDDNGDGTTASIIAGIDWVINHNSEDKPKVISMSLGSKSPGNWLNEPAENAVKNGIVTVVSAGNDNADACKYTPSGAPSVITVANSDINDKKYPDSNYGKCIDIIAPGTNIISTWAGRNTATFAATGTSMACPHVAGIAANYLSLGTKIDEIDSKIKSLATKDKITGFNSDTPNLLAFNGYE
jgi:subtilisin family serine protease